MGVSYPFFYKLKNMKIITSYYEFYRDSNKYYIENTGSVNPVYYKIYSVQNNLETLVGEAVNIISPSEIIEMNLPTEAIYKIVVIYDVAGSVENTSYDIRHFPSLKNSIITTMKEMICDCSNLDNTLNCTNSTVIPIIQDVYNIQMLLTSIGLYKDMLLSTSFLRQYNCCFTQTLGSNSSTLLSLLANIYTQLDLNGNSPNSTHLVRLYTAYMYILFFVIELDIAEYVTGSSGGVNDPELGGGSSRSFIPQTGDSEDAVAVKELFDIEDMQQCFTTLGLVSSSIYTTLDTCYKTFNFGSCVITSEIGTNSVSNLSYTSHTNYVSVDYAITPIQFTWDVEGIAEKSLVLDDNGVGTIENVDVSGTSFDTGINYAPTVPTIIRWTLSGDNVTDAELTTEWVYPAYKGQNTTGIIPTAAQVLIEPKIVDDFSESIEVEIVTGIGYFAWIAVPTVNSQYTQWEDINAKGNSGTIASNSFMYVTTLLVGGISYYIYMYKYPTNLTTTLKLS
jgi:hypothetical protein